MSTPSDPEPTPAEELLARRVGESGLAAVDYEELCRANPEHADELRRLVEHWRHVHGILAALGPEVPLARRLQRRYGSAAGADLSLDAPPRTGADAASSSTLRRLEAHAPQNSRYQLLGEVARGGMGAILKVWDADLRRTLAMKVMLGPRTEDSDSAPETSAKTLGRFLEEAQVTAQLDHPGILPVHELSLDADGRVYFTMPLVKGRDLADIFKLVKKGEEGWTQARAVGVLLKVCEAMAYAHSKRVIHRDLKPANVMVGRFGEVYVMDWGLARVLGRADEKDIRVKPLAELSMSLVQTDRKESGRNESAAGRSNSPLVTMDGDIVGTPSYMSPEQARGDLSAVGPSSDVFSLGSILYHVLAGHMPYVPDGAELNAYAVWGLVQSGSPAPLSEVAPGAPPELVAICEKAMAREASERYQDMRDVAEDLHAYLEGRVVGAYRTGPVIEFKKWVGRNKALAATLALAAGAAVTGGALHLEARERARQSLESRNVELAAMTRRAEEARDEAQRSSELLTAERDAAQAARAETERALEEARRQDYVANITSATINVDSGNPAEARRRLDACPESGRGWEWHHLDLALDASTHTLAGHTGQVHAVDFDAAGERIASGSEDDTVRIWDAATGTLLQVLEGHGKPVRALAFSPDDRLLATGARDGSLWIWDVAQGRKIAELDGHPRHITSLCFHPGGEQIVSGGADGQIRMWDIATGEMRFTHGFNNRGSIGVIFDVRALAFSEDGSRLFAGAGNGVARLIDVRTGESLVDVEGRDSSHESVVATPGGGFIVALGEGSVLPLGADGVWSEPSLTLDVSRLRAARLGPRGRRLLIGHEDKSLRLWDVERRTELTVLRGHGSAARALAFAPDGSRLVSSSRAAGDLKVWDVRTRSASFPLAVLDKGVRTIECSPDGSFFAVLEIASPRMRVFDALGTPLHTVPSGRKALSAMAIAPDGQSILVGASDGALSIWDAGTGALRALPGAHDRQVTSIAWDPGGTRFATGSYDGTLRVHDVDSGEQAQLDLEGVHVWGVDIDPRGRWVAAALADGRVVLWDSATDDVRELTGHDAIVTSVAFHPAGELLASGSDDATLRVWELVSGECVGVLRGHEGAVRALAIDPSGRRCVTGSSDQTLRVWDLGTLRTLATLEGDGSDVSTVAFSPDGERVFSGGPDRVVRVWESRLETATGVWHAAAQRRALESRLSALFMNHPDAARVEELVARDPALSGDERAMALQLVRARSSVPAAWMAEAAWSVVCDPDRRAEEYERAREAARIAAESRVHLTHRGYYRATLAFALYRLGRFDEALEMAGEAVPRLRRGYRNDRFPAPDATRAINETVAALSLAALGEHDAARERYQAIPAPDAEDRTLERIRSEAEPLLDL